MDPATGPVGRFASELRTLRQKAGGLTYRAMAKRAGYSVTTLSQAAAGERLPSLPVVLAFVEACDGDVAEWESRWREVAQELAREREADDGAGGPYLGLAAYGTRDADRFFGRDQLVEELSELLRRHRFAAVFGPSGSGKSSLLRAGLVPAARGGTASSGGSFAKAVILTPGEHPMEHAERLVPGEGDSETLIVVDQFEEVFTLCQDQEERARFIELLLSARQPAQRVRVVIAVRADFYGHCAGHRELTEALREANLLVGPMHRDELREAIVRPAMAEGLTVERALTAAIVSDVGDDPGALPLMSHALREVWRRRTGKTLTLDAYQSVGRIQGAISHTAEELYAGLTPAQAVIARRILLRLIQPGEQAQDTRRPAARAELDPYGEADTVRVIEQLAAARLLTLHQDGVQLAHEALIESWPRLRGWVDEGRDRLRAHRQLTEAAQAWQAQGREAGLLYRGSRLAVADKLFLEPGGRDDLTPVERDFVQASAALARRTARRRVAAAAALAVLLVAALGGLGSAEYLRRESNRQRDDALAQALALRAADLRRSDPQAAMLLSVAGWRLSPGLPEARGALYDSLSQSTTSVFADPDYTEGTVQALGHDGRTLVSVSGGTARIWDVPGKRRIGTLTGVGTGVREAALAPDGHTLALADGKAARLWDTRTGRPLGAPIPHKAGEDGGGELEFDRSGHYLAVPGRGLHEWWDVAGRKRLTAPSGAAINAISGNGRYGYALNGTTPELWDLRRGKRARIPTRRSDKGFIDGLAFSDDGRMLATVEALSSGEQSRLRLFELPSVYAVMDEEGEYVTDVAFAFGDEFIATWWRQSTLRLQRRSGFTTAYQRAMPDLVAQLRFDLAGRAVRYLSGSGVVHTEDVAMVFDRPITSGDGMGVEMDPSARVLAEITTENIEVMDTATGRPLIAPVGWSGTGTATAFSADGRRLAVAGGGKISIVDLAGRKVSARLKLTGNGGHGAQALAFSPDGRTLAVSRQGDPGRVELWDLERGSVRATTGHGAAYMAFRPDGRLLVTGNPFQLIDPATGATRPPTPGTGRLDGPFAFSPDGRQVAFSGPDRLTLWDGDVRTRIAQFSTVPGSETAVLAWSPDGRTIASYEKGLRVRLWDVPSRQPLGLVFDGKQSLDEAGDGWVAFSADGTKIHTAALDGTVRVHDVDERHVAATVCARAGRTLTAAEWSRHLPGVEPFTLCRPAESAARGPASGGERRGGR
ncbi:helix-turn-helix domain-containing protein [Nonomuraea sp. NPDC050733]|uniref:nSTAND1 domain-containing NTPase n=1 Tax=Nonomuraea sp. NPDC050733 TaxID=3154633 RepID=UPI0033F0FD8D